jgi:hypothetical protein
MPHPQFLWRVANSQQPSASGANWEKYKKTFADDEIEEKKITPLSDEYAQPDAAPPDCS